MDDSLYKLYSNPQHGAGMATFSGSKRHLIGGGILGTIARFAIPLLKSVGRTLMSGATRGATDYLAGNQNFLPAMVSGVGNEVASRMAPPKRKATRRQPAKKKRKISRI